MKTLKRRSSRRRHLKSGVFWLIISMSALFIIAIITSGSIAYAAHLEQRDVFCASCHTQPEATFYERAQSSSQVDLASYHRTQNTRCIDCHSGQGLDGRVAAILLGSKDLFHYLTSTAIQPAPLTVPIKDENCLKCHAEVVNTRDFNRHFHAFLPRWQAVDPSAGTCVDCHTSHTTNGQAKLAYLEVDGTRRVCEGCHAIAGR